MEGPKIVLHCVPIESFAGRQQYDVLQYYHAPQRLSPMQSSGWNRRINLNGVVSFSGHDAAFAYTQLYRTGIIEAVEASILDEYNGKRFIPSILFEQALLGYLPNCFRILKEIGCSAPVVVALTLTNANGLFMSDDLRPSLRGESHHIEVDTLVLPETVVEDLTTPANMILKPMFDLIWNACGYPSSKNFDAAGNWVNRK